MRAYDAIVKTTYKSITCDQSNMVAQIAMQTLFCYAEIVIAFGISA